MSSGKIVFNTIAQPAPVNGTAIEVLSGTVSLLNNIVTNHSTGIRRLSGTVFENFNLFFTVPTTLTGGLTSGGSSFTGDPKFVNPAADNYRLGFGSAALNAGTDVLVTVDFEGETRPQGSGFDIGFDEAQPAAPTPTPIPSPTPSPSPTSGPTRVLIASGVKAYNGGW